MSELTALVVAGVIRIFSVRFLLKSKEGVKNGYILLVLFVSFIYSAILTVILLAMFRPILLGTGLILSDKIDDEIFINALFVIYILGYISSIFAAEYYNNKICLKDHYSTKLILRTTIISHIFSFTLVVLYLIS